MKYFAIVLCVIGVIVISALALFNGKDDRGLMADKSYNGSTNAVPFPANLEWLNTSKLYTLEDFHGKIVLLDFWTYCCINCIHVIPELKKLEAKYPELVVIGVHSAKFHNEQIKENIRQAIIRYDLEHPVIIDNDFTLWHTYGIRAWPSFVLIDPEGRFVGKTSGEKIYDRLDPVIGKMSKEFEVKGILDKTRLTFSLEKEKVPEGILSYPGKLAVDTMGKRLFISDSNHNRVIIVKPSGEIIGVIGSGRIGHNDGDLASASFFHPQGMAFDPSANSLYVADTENHLIRKADLTTRTVSTLLGTGQQAGAFETEGVEQNLALNSPWDVVIGGRYLYIAMAGSHQIWRMDLKTNRAEVFAGSGREDIIDGARLRAALAQPSGITTDGNVIYFADSEVSGVRKITDDKVETIIGKGLFEFGDVDGIYPDARLQHPIGISFHKGSLYVADTYNHKIKIVHPEEKSVETFIGTGTSGYQDGSAIKALINEPNDVVFLDEKLYIADTNNNAIRIYNTATKKVSTLMLTNLELLLPAPKETEQPFDGESITLSKQNISPDVEALNVKITLPLGFHWNDEAPHFFRVTSDDEQVLRTLPFTPPDWSFDYTVPVHINKKGETNIRIQFIVYYCREGTGALCMVKSQELVVPVSVADGGNESLAITYPLLFSPNR